MVLPRGLILVASGWLVVSWADEPADPTSAPEDHVADYETARHVRRLISMLPERQREVVMLRIFEELSVQETARAMGCREGTVKALFHKAKSRLKTNLEKAGFVR